MIKAVIFDSDGMLTYDPGFSKTYSANYNIPLEEMTSFFTGPFKNCLIGRADLKEELQKGWLTKWRWPGTVDEFLEYWFSVGGPLEVEVFESISNMRKSGVICVLATNQEKYRTERIAARFGYHDAFDKIFSSAYVGHKKPTNDFFQVVFNYLLEKDPSITKDEVIFWDDDIENIEGAKSFGILAEQYLNPDHHKEVMDEYGLLKVNI
jgi:putative hydrolase of the HAD superfamily